MMHIGAYNIHPFLPVVNKKTDNAINTKDANNWFAAPNNGQMLLYPPKHNKNPKNNVARMEHAEIKAHLIDVKIADTPIHCKVYGEEHCDYYWFKTCKGSKEYI